MKVLCLFLALCLAASAARAERYYPRSDGPWEASALDRAGIDRERFDEFLDYSFARNRFAKTPHRTNSLIVLLRGRILHEEYRAGFRPPRDKQYIWSLTKSLANGILGRAERKGFIQRSTRVGDHLPGFDDPKAKKLTLADLMRMSSGIRFFEEHPDGFLMSNAIYMNYSWRGVQDVVSYMTRQGFKHPAGKQFNYSSGDCNLSMALLRKRFDDPSVNRGRDPQTAYNTFPWRELFRKIGMRSTTIEQDGSGNFVAGSFGWSTARDMARLALLYLRGGEWDLDHDGEISKDEKLFNPDWVAFSMRVAPALKDETFPADEDGLRLNREAYGAFWWLNRPIEASGNASPYPDLPDNAQIGVGLRGQTLVVMPSQRIVIVRLGSDGMGKKIDRNKFFRMFMASLPEKPARKSHHAEATTGYDFSDASTLNIARISEHFAESVDGEMTFDDALSVAPAKDLCSCLFVMKKDEPFCYEDNSQLTLLRGLGLVSAPTIDYETKSVTATSRILPVLDYLPALRWLFPSSHTATVRYVNEDLGCMVSRITAPWRGPVGPLNILGDAEWRPSVNYFD